MQSSWGLQASSESKPASTSPALNLSQGCPRQTLLPGNPRTLARLPSVVPTVSQIRWSPFCSLSLPPTHNTHLGHPGMRAAIGHYLALVRPLANGGRLQPPVLRCAVGQQALQGAANPVAPVQLVLPCRCTAPLPAGAVNPVAPVQLALSCRCTAPLPSPTNRCGYGPYPPSILAPRGTPSHRHVGRA